MGNEFKDFEMETPSLTLEPDLGELRKERRSDPPKAATEGRSACTDTGRTEDGGRFCHLRLMWRI